MEKPNATTIAYYDRNVPPDGRAVKGQMFGHPCAFVNGHMFLALSLSPSLCGSALTARPPWQRASCAF